MAFKMKGFKAHDMFDPKTGKKFRAKKLADHNRMDKMGYTHDSPKKKKGPCWKNYEMVGMKSKGGRKVPNCVPKK